MIESKRYTALNAVTATTTSGGIQTGLFGNVTIQFTAASITSGNGVFTIDVSNDGTTWTAYNRLTTNVTNTNAQTDTRVASVTLSSNLSQVVKIPDLFNFIRVTCTRTTDGAYTAVVYTS